MPGALDGRMLDLRRVIAEHSCRGRRRLDRAPRPLHQLRARPVLLPPARPGADREAGRPVRSDRVRGQPRAGARADRPRGRRSWPRPSTSAPTTCRPWRRPASSWSGRTAPRTCSPSRSATATCSTWDFIGALQSRKLKDIAPNVRLIHSIASESALAPARAASGQGGADPGQRGRRGVQGGRRPRRAGRTTSSAAPVP